MVVNRKSNKFERNGIVLKKWKSELLFKHKSNFINKNGKNSVLSYLLISAWKLQVVSVDQRHCDKQNMHYVTSKYGSFLNFCRCYQLRYNGTGTYEVIHTCF